MNEIQQYLGDTTVISLLSWSENEEASLMQHISKLFPITVTLINKFMKQELE